MNKVIVFKDKLLIDWDGTLPPGTSPSIVHGPQDVPFAWPHLNGYTRYSKRSGKYVLNFSHQNIKRIRNQFKEFKWQGETEKCHELKEQMDEFEEFKKKVHAIRNAPIEKLPKYNYKAPPLGDWQHRVVVFLVNIPTSPLFADCGTGKTFCVLTSTEIQIQKGLLMPGKTLIAAKLATLESGWLEDAEKFTNLKINVLWEASSYKKKEKICRKLEEDADVYVINHDGVRVYEEQLAAKKFEKIVVDESTILKGFRGMDPRTKGGAFGKSLHRISEHAKYKVIMSGTPAPNGPCDLWGQFAFLDPSGVLLEPNFKDFETNYYDVVDLRPAHMRHKPMGPKTPRKMVPSKGSEERIGSIINPLSWRVKLRDHIDDFPELTIMKRFCHMGSEQSKHYKDMEEKLKIEINDERITVPIALAKMMKLRQVTGGFVIDNQEKAHEIPKAPKMSELDSLINEEIASDEKVVIYAQYRWEIEQIVNRYKKLGVVSVYGGNSSKINLENIQTFRKTDDARIIVLHPKSAAHGITFTMARYMIFYSISHSAEDNYQCIKRIERAGQKNAMFVYYLLCKNSIDDSIYQVLNMKDRMQEKILDGQNNIDYSLIKAWRSDGSKGKG